MQAGRGEDGYGECAGVGGKGAYLAGTLAVQTGDEITIIVGSNGENTPDQGGAGGAMSGGAGGSPSIIYINGS